MGNYTKTFPYELGLTSRVVQEAGCEFFKQNKYPVTMDEFIILDCIYLNPDIIQMQLAKLILKGKGHTGKLLKSLEDKKMIIRTPAILKSKAVMRLEITSQGLEWYKKISSELDELSSEIDANILIKINDVISMLQTIREDMIKKFNIKFE